MTASETALAGIAARANAADRHGGDLSADIAALSEIGWLAAGLPCAAGGKGWGCEAAGARSAFDALRALGRANLSVARLFEGHLNAIKLLVLYGSPPLREDIFAEIREGLLLGVWGADDPDAPLRAETENDAVKLSGAKRFASGLGLVGKAVVTAAGADGPQLLLVPTSNSERADPATWRMGGMRATQSGRYDLTGLKVGTKSLLGEPGDYLREPHFEGGIWRYCAAHLGAAEGIYEDMRDMLARQGRDGDPHQQRRIAGGAVAVETARLWLLRAATEVEADNALADKAALSLLAREVTDRNCRTVMEQAESALGMAAHVEGSRIERACRDLRLFLKQAAPDAKLARAAEALTGRAVLVEHL